MIRSDIWHNYREWSFKTVSRVKFGSILKHNECHSYQTAPVNCFYDYLRNTYINLKLRFNLNHQQHQWCKLVAGKPSKADVLSVSPSSERRTKSERLTLEKNSASKCVTLAKSHNLVPRDFPPTRGQLLRRKSSGNEVASFINNSIFLSYSPINKPNVKIKLYYFL